VVSHSAEAKSYSLKDTSFSMEDFRAELMPETAKVLEIPLGDDTAVRVLYFVPNHRVDQVVKHLNVRSFEIKRDANVANKGG